MVSPSFASLQSDIDNEPLSSWIAPFLPSERILVEEEVRLDTWTEAEDTDATPLQLSTNFVVQIEPEEGHEGAEDGDVSRRAGLDSIRAEIEALHLWYEGYVRRLIGIGLSIHGEEEDLESGLGSLRDLIYVDEDRRAGFSSSLGGSLLPHSFNLSENVAPDATENHLDRIPQDLGGSTFPPPSNSHTHFLDRRNSLPRLLLSRSARRHRRRTDALRSREWTMETWEGHGDTELCADGDDLSGATLDANGDQIEGEESSSEVVGPGWVPIAQWGRGMQLLGPDVGEVCGVRFDGNGNTMSRLNDDCGVEFKKLGQLVGGEGSRNLTWRGTDGMCIGR